MRSQSALLSLSAAILVVHAPAAWPQSWLDVVKDKAAARVVDHAEQAVDQGLDATEDAIKCVAADQACIDQAQESGKQVVVTNKKGKPLPPDQQPKAGAASSAGSTGVAASRGGGQAGGQPNLTAVKSDFVPGDKTIFFDDFSDMAGGEAPPHWRVKSGMTELRTGGGIRQLTLLEANTVLSPNLKVLPKNFTLESEFQFGNVSMNGMSAGWYLLKKDGNEALMIKTFAQEADEGNSFSVEAIANGWQSNQQDIGKVASRRSWRNPVRQALWVQDGRVRIYVDGNRIMDVNQIDVSQVASIEFRVDMNNSPGGTTGLRQVRFAESAPDFSKVISSGRYVTHGILFDTDSDRIKTDSAATIKMIANGMQSSAGSRYLIEGHTDSTGDSAHNLDLSKRRAEAVKAVLVSQFGVDAARLSTTGLGSTKPMSSNDSPQGRAENRRVEFVRQ